MLSRAEISSRLFNVLFEIIMPQLYQLQESPIEKDQKLAVLIANALYRLYGAIIVINQVSNMWRTFCGETEGKLSETRLAGVKLTSIQDMLTSCFHTYNHTEKSYQINPSLYNALNNNAAYGATLILQETLGILEKLNFHVILQQNGRNNTLMHTGVYNSIIMAKRLCELAQKGDLRSIKKLNFSNDEVDLVIDRGWNGLTDKISLYLGRYNALAVAVWYRRYLVIKYFIATGANVNTKIGRVGEVTISSCAGIIPFFSEPHCRSCHDYILEAEFKNPNRPLPINSSTLIAKSIFRPPVDYTERHTAEVACLMR